MNVLHIGGDAPDGATKDKLWDIYNKIGPDYRAGDLVLNVNVAVSASSGFFRTTTNFF